MSDRCGECERSAIYVHTAKIEREHDAMVIADLSRRLKEQDSKIKDLEKRLGVKK